MPLQSEVESLEEERQKSGSFGDPSRFNADSDFVSTASVSSCGDWSVSAW